MVDAVIVNESPAESLDALVDLPRGEGYQIDGADEITTRSPTNVILFAGTAECGKTTLLASLYLLFQKGPFCGYSFCGSKTLVGFEKRVHNARLASRLAKPKTERSKVSELLHLRIGKTDKSAPPRDVLLCDLWGEDFREARDSIEGCKRLPIISRADSLVVLVDGGRLSKLDRRQQAKSDPIALLRNVIDCQMIGELADIDIVHTKWDDVEASADRADTEQFAEHVDQEIKRLFLSRVGRLRFTRIAAHALDGSRPLGFGVDELFKRWVERDPGAARVRVRLAPEPPQASEYDRFLARAFRNASGSTT